MKEIYDTTNISNLVDKIYNRFIKESTDKIEAIIHLVTLPDNWEGWNTFETITDLLEERDKFAVAFHMADIGILFSVNEYKQYIGGFVLERELRKRVERNQNGQDER